MFNGLCVCSYGLHKAAQASLSSGINLVEAVKLPPGEELNDWLAVHGERETFNTRDRSNKNATL